MCYLTVCVWWTCVRAQCEAAESKPIELPKAEHKAAEKQAEPPKADTPAKDAKDAQEEDDKDKDKDDHKAGRTGGKNGSQGSRKVASTETIPLWIRRGLHRRPSLRRVPRFQAYLGLFLLFLCVYANPPDATPTRHRVLSQVGGQCKAGGDVLGVIKARLPDVISLGPGLCVYISL